ncbi:ABC transporter permease [Sulfitobacter donghicola]|uniref:ABC transporter permease n=1 Tax=Sulfitobacter donghicola DSW-25 = KCTC 12864 = JCM 14565 TaxID=1300350 RepID=A0A073ICX5_9RHOB|nr:FtsX-like permease family protein [Sulfitobacter donghicola]KEJ88198.1 ABC transporter permease [Sulfitobacter donghicola DSW-25 = KCTC 12864 = JCM 14565]KIN68790.1 Permease [Sulfitobacter donghicola DSW-25 = KCTC 12864 = JCM 14565]
MIAAGLSALWSHWRRNPLQLFTLIAGLALATALWSGVQAINAEARASYDAAAATLGEGQYDQLVPTSGATIPNETFVALRRAGWLVSPVVEGHLSIEGVQIRLVGIDPLTAPSGLGPASTGDDDAQLATVLQTRPVFAAPAVADLLEGHIDAEIRTTPEVAPDTALTDISIAQELLGAKGTLNRLIIAPAQPVGRPPLQQIAPELERIVAQGGSDVGRLTDSFHLNLTAFGLLSFAVGIFIVHGAIGLAFEQRRAMVRTLRALGMPLITLIFLMAAELLLLALIGGVLGVFIGYLIAASLLPDVAATLKGLYGADVSGALQFRASWWLSGLAISVFGTTIAAAGALVSVARMPLLASAQPRAWATARGKVRLVQMGASAALLAMAGLLAVWGQGLIMGFGLLACLLVGAALVLPLFLGGVLAFAEKRAKGVTAQWFWADTRQQLSGLSLALMALLLAMAANVGVSTMVSSFRLTFTGFLDQRLASELYVSTESTDQARDFETYIKNHTSEILPLLSTDAELAGLPAEIYGARVGRTYRENWTLLASSAQVWERVANGEAVLVNEQLARRARLWVGDRLALSAEHSLPIAGVFGDYGNPIGKAIVSEPLFKRLYPLIQATRFGLRTDDPLGLRAQLINDFGLSEQSITDQAQIKSFSLSVFERTFTVTAALNVLTLSVAGFAIFMSLLTLAGMRLPQLAPAWALGLTRSRLGQLELIRAVVLATLTAAMALPLGLALAWVLLAVVNVEAFGWRLPMFFFPQDYALLGLFALAAALIAAAWPARRLARTPPADLLKVFANER